MVDAGASDYVSLALNSAGNPVMSYYDYVNGDLKVAVCGNAACTSAVTRIVDSAGDVGQYSLLALDGADKPVISYYDYDNADLKVALCSDAACTTPTITVLAPDGAFEWGPSLALAAGKQIAGYDNYGMVELAVCTTADCQPRVQYTITPSAGPGGSISPATSQTVNSGESLTFTVSPNAGYSIAGVTVDGIAQGAISSYTFNNVTADHMIAATFTINTYPVTYNPNGATGGTAPPAQVKTHDTPLTLQPNSGGLVKEGLAFISWNTQADGGGTDFAAGATYTDNAPLALYAKWACAVRTAADSGPGSLRQAVLDAAPGDTLCFAPALAGQTITLGSEIVLDKSITISGTVPVALSGNNATRLLNVRERLTAVHLYGLTLRDGKAEKGGAIYMQGANLRIERSAILNNVAQAGGGVYMFDSNVVIENSTLAGNRAVQSPGGQAAAGATGAVAGVAVYIESGVVTISFSTLAHNEAGEGIVSDGSCSLGSDGDRNNVGPQVSALQPDGTAPLLPDSVAIAHIPSGCPATDQVGNVLAAPCDAGAAKFGGTAQARLHTTLRAGLNNPYQGDSFGYTVTVENRGAAAATGLKISLSLPDRLTPTGSRTWTSGASCDLVSPNLTCTTPLARDSQFHLNVEVRVMTVDVAELAATATAEAAAPVTLATASLLVTSRGPRPLMVGVGQTYRTIQGAVDAAPAGATILVYPAITSTVAMTGPGGLSAGGEAVISVNGPPTAVDDSATTRPGEEIALWPLLNDPNPDRSPLRLASLGSPANGSSTCRRTARWSTRSTSPTATGARSPRTPC